MPGLPGGAYPGQVLFPAPLSPSTTSYSNPCGSGDRRSLIIITPTSGSVGGSLTLIPGLIDGSRTDNSFFWAGAGTGCVLEFWFPSKKIIDEATYYQQTTAAQGTWKWQGSNDRTTWTDIGGTFALGGATTQVLTTLAGNTTGYVFYRLVQVSGTTSSSPWVYEIEFKIDEAGTTSYLHPLGSGNRTATIATTASGITWAPGVPSTLVDGDVAALVLGWNATTVAGSWVQFDLGSAIVVQQARFRLDRANAQGDWKLQGSPDASAWTDISATVTLGVAVSPTFVTCFGGGESNTIAYRYYRLLGVAGSRTNSPWLLEVEFMVGAAPGPALAASASITIATAALLSLALTPLAATSSLRLSTTATLTLSLPLAALSAVHLSTSATLTIPGPLRVTQTTAEVFGTIGPSTARVTQVVLEVFGPAPEIRFTRDPAIGLTWVEFTDAAGTTHVWSDVALPDPINYYFGFKDNRVTRWGTIRRSLSDDAGQYVGSELAWTVSDADHAVRALLADPATRAFANRPCVVRMIPDAGRRALDRPRDVYFGIVRDYQPSAPLTVDFTARDYFDAVFNPTGDQLFPRRVVTTADFPLATGSFTVGANPFTDPPTPGTTFAIGAIALPVPIIYGRITDQFFMDGEDQGDGQCPAVLVGLETLSDGREYYQWLVAGHACQGIDELYVNNDPQGLATDPAIGGSGGLWKVPGYAGWTDEFPDPYRDINGHRYTLVYGRRGPETTLSASAIGDPAVLTVADTSLFVDGADAIVSDHQGATPAVNGVYPITILDATHVSIPVALTAAGTGGTLRQVFGPDLAAGAAEAVVGQSVPFALDVRGIETTGDGTGTLIVDGPLQYLHALLNWIIGDYQTGAWTSDPPVFPDASRLPLVDVSSFVRANSIAHTRVAGGYRGDFVLGATAIGPGRTRLGGTRITARDLLQRFNASFDLSVGFNRHSQFTASMLDDSPAGLAAQAVATRFVDMIDVVKDSLTITDAVAQLYNRIPWRDTEDYFGRMSGADAQPFTQDLNDINWRSLNSGVSYIDDAASIAAYSTNPAILTPMVAPTRLLYLVRSKARDTDSDVYLQGTATREDVIARYLARHRDPPRTARFTIGLLGFNLDLGDLVRLSHFAGIGATGWVDQRLRIVAHDADLRQQRVTLTTEDLGTGADE